MPFWQNLLRGVAGTGTALFQPRVTYVGGEQLAHLVDPSGLTATQMWQSQPHVRTVVSFLARNIAQLGLHTFERVNDTDRRRDHASPAARALAHVDGTMTTHELIYSLVVDLCLYDRAYWWVSLSSDSPSGWVIRRLPPEWVRPVQKNAWEVAEYQVFVGKAVETVPADTILDFRGYQPGAALGSSSTIDALRETLTEQMESAKYRAKVWERGGRVSAVLNRPATAPQWSNEAREAFREDWYAKYTGQGSRVGGTPILEDGMTLQTVDFSARDQQFVEAARLSLTTVAAAFHVNPTMIGQNEGANYASVREFRKMLYGDTLGPIIAQVEARLNAFLLPRLGMDPARFYVEFNIAEKLQGNFEDQAQQLQASVGGPYMTRNEARALQNLPALDGGDELIVPLNVITGGQASPLDSGSQNLRAAPTPTVKAAKRTRRELEIKAPAATGEIPTEHADALADVFRGFFARQRRAVMSARGAKSPTWWDQERWERELQDDLLEAGLDVSTAAALGVLAELGVDADEYSQGRTEKFLTAVAERISRQTNAGTLAAIEDALDDEDDEDDDVDGDPVAAVFDEAETSRSDMLAQTAAATFVGFGLMEGPRQARPRARKRWVVNSSNPRASHAALDGEEVFLDEDFSNGMPWPGSFTGDPEDTANCECSLIISTED